MMKCVDLGSEYCPCPLALTGDCLICSRLQERSGFDGSSERMFPSGEDCDCEWSGSCPYTVLVQNGGKVAEGRQEFPVRLVERKDYGEDGSVLVLDVGRGLAQKASQPGSFVFLRRVQGEDQNRGAAETGSFVYGDTPISVMRADEAEGTIHLAIRREGPKSKMLLDRALAIDDVREEKACGSLKYKETYQIRGPYYSGLLGKEALRPANVKGKKILFLTKGIGAAPVLLTMNRLMTMDGTEGGKVQGAEKKPLTQIRWLADDTKIDRKLIEDYVRMIGGDIRPEYTVLAGSPGAGRMVELLGEEYYDTVVISGSPYFVETMRREMKTLLPEAELVVSNNATMCCGEGICGACTEVAEDGRVIRRCKCDER